MTEKKIPMSAAQILQYLLDIIDKYAAEEKGKDEGPFCFLREDMAVRYFATTPNCRAGLKSLKTYFTKNILEINYGTSKVTYKNILDNLKGQACKKYQMDTTRLDSCFEPGKNYDAVRKYALLYREESTEQEEQLKETLKKGDVSWLLLTWIQQDVERQLLRFWKLCDAKQDEHVIQKKEEAYMSALYGIALHEIFFKEMLQTKVFERKNAIDTGLIKVSEYTEQVKKDSPKEALVLESLQQIQAATEKVNRLLDEYHVYWLLAVEQNINLYDEISLIMIFDSINRKKNTPKLIEDWLGGLGKEDMRGFDADNPNRRMAYQRMQAYVKEILVSYWENIPVGQKQDFPQAVKIYFEQIDIGSRGPDRADCKKLLLARGTLVREWFAINSGEVTNAKEME